MSRLKPLAVIFVTLSVVSLNPYGVEVQAGKESAAHWVVDSSGIFEIPVHNPSPETLPSLVVKRPRAHDFCVFITTTFPEVPGLICDAWCFEGGTMTFSDARELSGGGVEVRHRMIKHPNVVHVMTLVPEPGAVSYHGRLEMEAGEVSGSTKTLDEIVPLNEVPNICFQVKRGLGFQAAPEGAPRCSPVPEHAKNYWENFVSRCFIFTDKGMTRMSDTQRTDTSKDHNFPADDPRNNPPAVQRYYGVWTNVPEGEGTSSRTRYDIPAVGVVSRDGNHLLAGTGDDVRFISQAWLDCFHLYSQWTPPEKPAAEREWNLKIYAMENDPDELLLRVKKDFPGIERLQEKRVE